jgi:hypothetical protein
VPGAPPIEASGPSPAGDAERQAPTEVFVGRRLFGDLECPATRLHLPAPPVDRSHSNRSHQRRGAHSKASFIACNAGLLSQLCHCRASRKVGSRQGMKPVMGPTVTNVSG